MNLHNSTKKSQVQVWTKVEKISLLFVCVFHKSLFPWSALFDTIINGLFFVVFFKSGEEFKKYTMTEQKVLKNNLKIKNPFD